ncbi:MAG: GIY-YIG nuclease family protein [Rhodospirillales bacterium]|nr:GIY-YIG nuclease family protein [Rhodospirillales bacterium]MCB9995767.1 GIY-YIG nuclease family protein [Rhodospirillales bacterium]
MYYVYLLQSISSPKERYIGYTEDVEKRLKAHNAGESRHTSKYCPWRLIGYHAFSDKRTAQAFEYYLKTGSGKAFAKKRLWCAGE